MNMKIRRVFITVILAISLLFLTSCSLLFNNVFSDKHYDVSGLEYRIEGYGALFEVPRVHITGIGNYIGNKLVIPEEIGKYKVTAIDPGAFKDQTHLTTVSFSKNLSSIGSQAFSGCTSLSDLVIPEWISYVGKGAFENCPLIDTVIVEGSHLNNAMFNNSCIKTVIFKGEEVGPSVLEGVNTVETVIMDNGVKRVSESAFLNCTSLKSVSIPLSLRTIKERGFSGCTSLTEITIPNVVVYIEKQAFQGCTGLSEFVIPNSVETVGEGAFKDCSSLETVTVGQGVKIIDEGAFADCTSLKEVYFNAAEAVVKKEAFLGCDNIERLIVPDMKSWCGNQFAAGHNEPSMPYGKNGVIEVNGKAVTELELGGKDGITAIRSGTFFNYSHLKSIKIGAGLESIESFAFANCTNVTDIAVEDPESCNIDGYAFMGYTQFEEVDPELFKAVGGSFINWTSLKLVDIGDDCKYINNSAFEGCTLIESIKIPKKCRYIYSNAFRNCTALSQVDFSDCTALNTIGDGAFEGCTSLEEIHLPGTIYNVGKRAFSGCTALKSFNMPVRVISEEAFMGCTSLTEITLGDAVKTIEVRAFAQCTNLNKFILPHTIGEIKAWAFEGCTNLDKVYYNGRSLIWARNVKLALKWYEGSSLTCVVCEDTEVQL